MRIAGSFGHTLSGIHYNWTSSSPLTMENIELAQVLQMQKVVICVTKT